MQVQDPVLAHELDAAWIIALWKAIHGGDPAPEAVAAQVIAVLAPYLNGAPSLSVSELEANFANFGIHMIERSEVENSDSPILESLDEPSCRRTRQYCFQVGRQTVCTQLPELTRRETAA